MNIISKNKMLHKCQITVHGACGMGTAVPLLLRPLLLFSTTEVHWELTEDNMMLTDGVAKSHNLRSLPTTLATPGL